MTEQPPLPPPKRLERLKDWFRKHEVARRHEQLYPSFWALVGAAIVARTPLSDDAVYALIDTVLPIAISVAAVLAGFQATAQSVMLALIDSKAANFLRRTGHYDTLVDFHWDSIVLLFSFIGIAMLAVIARAVDMANAEAMRLAPMFLAFLFLRAALANVRTTHLMVKLLRHKDGPVLRDVNSDGSG